MAINKKQLAGSISEVLGTCPRPELASPAAVELLLGTAAKESGFGTYLEQLGTGPAKGFWQMEPATAKWLEGLACKSPLPPDLLKWARSFRDDETVEWALEYRIDYQIAMCRLRYWVVPAELPAAGDTVAQAAYWKRWYNTPRGSGTEQEYLDDYKKFVAQR